MSLCSNPARCLGYSAAGGSRSALRRRSFSFRRGQCTESSRGRLLCPAAALSRVSAARRRGSGVTPGDFRGGRGSPNATRPQAASICDAAAAIGQCPDTTRALTLATLAGLSTTLGGIAAVLRQPDNALLAFLLGTAIGVMLTLSVVELWLNNALENDFLEVTLCTGFGAMLYCLLGPLVPELPLGKGSDAAGTGIMAHSHASMSDKPAAEASEGPLPEAAAEGDASASDDEDRRKKLMRLGLLMAVSMTLHNLPEGFAVAFASFTDFGPKMAFAVAMHNIPEGIIVAAPIYASTGSRVLAIGMSLASGLSEPAGAVIALAALGSYLSPDTLQLVLGTVGGIMGAVCIVELLPEGRKCKEDKQLALGTAVGSLVMGATLAAGV